MAEGRLWSILTDVWWDLQNLDKPHRDKSGKRWNFRVWHDVVNGRHVARVFFWDDERKTCGVRLFHPDDDTHVTKLHAFIKKVVASKAIRSKYLRELCFPLEQHYSEYGVFPGEATQREARS